MKNVSILLRQRARSLMVTLAPGGRVPPSSSLKQNILVSSEVRAASVRGRGNRPSPPGGVFGRKASSYPAVASAPLGFAAALAPPGPFAVAVTFGLPAAFVSQR